MDITPSFPGDRMVIQAYGSGWFKVSDSYYEGPILVFPDRVETWPVAGFEALTVADFDPVAANDPPVEVLLVGCGARMQLIRRAFKDSLKAATGLVPDPMDSGAACRAYNVVMAEDRRVCAALIPT